MISLERVRIRAAERVRLNLSRRWKSLLTLVILSVAGILPYSSFGYSPFVVPVLAAALGLGPGPFFLIYLLQSGLALIRGLSYMLEIAFAGFLFLLSAFLPLKTRKISLNGLIPVLLTETVLAIVYIAGARQLEAVLTCAVFFAAAAGTFYVLGGALNALELGKGLDAPTFVGVLLLSPLFFAFAPLIAFVFFVLGLFLFYDRTSKLSWRLSFVFASYLIAVYLCKVDAYLAKVIALPFILTVWPLGKREPYIVAPLSLGIYMWAYPRFWRQTDFFMLIGAVCLYFVLRPWLPAVVRQEKRSDDLSLKLSGMQRNMTLIDDYLKLVKTTCTRDSLSPETRVLKELDESLCRTCQSSKDCALRKEFTSLLSRKADRELQTQVERLCLYPAKYLYRVKNMKSVYERARLQNELEEEEKRSRLELLERIAEPIEQTLKIEETNTDVVGALNARGHHIYEIEEAGENVIVKGETDKAETLVTDLSSLLCRPLRPVEENYSYLDKCRRWIFAKSAPYRFEALVYQRAYQSISGDTFRYYEENGIFTLALSDGMGHQEDSYRISRYLINVLLTLLDLGQADEAAIVETNRLLKLNAGEEDYATLDLLRVDLATLEADLYKLGSYLTCLYHDGILYEYDRIYPPLGIVDDPEFDRTRLALKPGDIVLLMTDGLLGISHQALNSCFRGNGELEVIRDELARLLKEEADDDQTFILLKAVEV